MKTVRIVALVLACLGLVGSIVSIISLLVANTEYIQSLLGNYFSEELLESMLTMFAASRVITLVTTVFTTIWLIVDLILLACGVKNAAILVFGIISILGGALITGILMCVYYGFARKEKNKIQEEKQVQEETQEQMA